MTTNLMWKSLDLYFALTIKTVPYYVDCSLHHSRMIPQRILPWLVFVISAFIQLFSELVFLLQILFDKDFYETVKSFEILLSALFFTTMVFYFVLFLTVVIYYAELIQLFNGFMVLERKFLGMSPSLQYYYAN